MSLQSLFPHLRGFRLLALCREPDRLVVTCERVIPSASCPLCGTRAHRIHSHYQRTVSDVPIQATPVLVHLRVRKFYCDQPECPRRIFTERLPQVTPPYGRFTEGLRHLLGRLGREHGGASGARSAHLLGLCVTGRVVLRFMHALPLPVFPPPRVIGLDDWAWKRRERYGAIVVDLERGPRLPYCLIGRKRRCDRGGVPTFFPSKIPSKAPARLRAGMSRACSLVAWEQRQPSAGNFPYHIGQHVLLGQGRKPFEQTARQA